MDHHLRLLGSKKREEHVECNLDSINVRNTPLVGDELEVDKVHNRPNLPGSLASSQEVSPDLSSNGSQGISVDKTKIGEEDAHEDGAPDNLIDSDLGEDGDSIRSGELLIEKVVEVVSRGAVVDESKESKGGKALIVDGSTGDEELSEQITKEPTNKRGKSLHSNGLLIQSIRISLKSGDSSTSRDGRVAEQGANFSRMLLSEG